MTEINRVVISSGHSLKVRGAAGVLDEVDEARRVVDVADELGDMGVEVTYSMTMKVRAKARIQRIVAAHNQEERDLDVSIHFNAYVETTGPMGCEVLYLSQAESPQGFGGDRVLRVEELRRQKEDRPIFA